MGIRARLTLWLVAVCLVAVVAAAGALLDRHASALRRGVVGEARRSAELLARSFTALLLRGQVSAIHEMADETLRAQRGDPAAPLRYLDVADDRGGVVFSSARDDEDRVLEPEVADALTRAVLQTQEAAARVIRARDGSAVLDVAAPCAVDGIDDRRRVYGVVRIGIGLEPLLERWNLALVRALAAALVAIFLGAVVGSVAAGGALRAVDAMTQVVGKVAAGDLTPRVQLARGDELGTLADAIDQMADDLQKRDLLKRYISASAWEEIEERGLSYSEEHDVALKEVTVLFLDIRNYTSLSEEYESREIVAMLNEVFTVLIGVVDEFGGVIDKFIGDALLVVFYPGDEADDAVRAVFAGARMQEALQAFNQRREFYGREAISIGVGINTGTVIAGSVGSRERKDYTVIGDPVNVASRLQERSKEGRHTRVVLSESTLEQVQSLVEVEPLAGRNVRGKRAEIVAYELVAIQGLMGILDGLEAEDPQVREEAFRALEATGGPVAIPHLVQVLGSERQGAILKAIPMLARLGRESAGVARLLDAIIQDAGDTHILATAVRAVGHLEGYDGGERLRPFLEHPDPRVRANAIEALDALDLPGFEDSVAARIHDDHQRVKANAAVALFKRGRPEVVPHLIELSRTGDDAARAAATFSMGELFVAEASRGQAQDLEVCVRWIGEDLAAFRSLADALVERLSDPKDEVVEKAVVALSKARDTAALGRLAALATEEQGADRDQVLRAVARIGVPPRVARVLREWRQLKEAQETSAQG